MQGDIIFLNITYFYCFYRLQQALTMDLILSAVFGLQANSQDNPDDPFISAARQALKQSFSKKILLGSLLPFGIKIMEKFPSVWLSNALPLLKMTEKIILAKKTGNGSSSRKVYFIIVRKEPTTNSTHISMTPGPELNRIG